MLDHETSFVYYLKNYVFTLEDYLRKGKEEFFITVYCDFVKMPDHTKESIKSEIKYVKSIISAYEQFRNL